MYSWNSEPDVRITTLFFENLFLNAPAEPITVVMSTILATGLSLLFGWTFVGLLIADVILTVTWTVILTMIDTLNTYKRIIKLNVIESIERILK